MDSLGISKLDLKRQNRMQILRQLRNNGAISRIDLARNLHITKAAVTIITNEMIEEGIIYEIGEQAPAAGKTQRGRKKILLGINSTWKFALGISLHDGWLDVGLCTLLGASVEHHSVKFEGGIDRLLKMISDMYNDLAYKNSLKEDNLLGAGLSIDRSYVSILGEKDGELNFSVISQPLEKLIHAPVVCGELMEGIATAECDFRSAFPSPSHQLVMQMGGTFSSCVVICQERYRGSGGKACDFGNLRIDGTPAKIKLARKTVNATIDDMRERRLCPALTMQSMENPERAEWIFCRSGFVPEDSAVKQYFDQVRKDYSDLLMTAAVLLDPDEIAVFPENSVMEALTQAISAVNDALGREAVHFSRFDNTNLYLTGAALAIRELFTGRGGACDKPAHKN